MSKTSTYKPPVQRQFDLARENAIRRRILKDFNKRQDDFATLRDYNDYLEEVEDINVEETNEKIKQYKEENKKLIRTNQLKKEEEERQKRFAEEMRLKAEQNKDNVTTDGAARADQQKQQAGYVPQPVSAQPVFRQPQPKAAQPGASSSNKPVDQATRIQAGGYKPEYPLLRARIEADQTVF